MAPPSDLDRAHAPPQQRRKQKWLTASPRLRSHQVAVISQHFRTAGSASPSPQNPKDSDVGVPSETSDCMSGISAVVKCFPYPIRYQPVPYAIHFCSLRHAPLLRSSPGTTIAGIRNSACSHCDICKSAPHAGMAQRLLTPLRKAQRLGR